MNSYQNEELSNIIFFDKIHEKIKNNLNYTFNNDTEMDSIEYIYPDLDDSASKIDDSAPKIDESETSDDESSDDESSDDESEKSEKSDDESCISLKPSTQYCYLNTFYKFWVWLSKNYPKNLNYSPPLNSPKKISDLKNIIPIKLITPNIFWEYIKSENKSKKMVTKIKCSLKYVLKEFNMEDEYITLIKEEKDIVLVKEEKDIINTKRRCSQKNQLVPPPAKRSCVTPTIISLNDDFKLLYIKNVAQHLLKKIEELYPEKD